MYVVLMAGLAKRMLCLIFSCTTQFRPGQKKTTWVFALLMSKNFAWTTNSLRV